MTNVVETRSKHRCFGGVVGFYKHAAASTACDMNFSLFMPPKSASGGKVPGLVFLSGLTCTEENATIKAGAYRVAAELGLALVMPDTSPRGPGVPPGDNGDLGFGAGFYVDATVAPWSTNYRMESYVTRDLHDLVTTAFPVDASRMGIFGHSMGGHGALTLFQKHPRQYRSLSAFAPICNLSQTSWGQKALGHYLGPDEEKWRAHDACELLLAGGPVKTPILIDQGSEDSFLDRLCPAAFEAAARRVGQTLTLRWQGGYDHGYFFVQTFMEDHLRHHAEQLALPHT